jgi:OPA family sugar phosphate sensor protein UhpC-like MFS transporter
MQIKEGVLRMANYLKFLQPASPVSPITDKQTIKSEYNYWRIRIFYSMYIGYAFYYFTRKSFTFAMPSLAADLGYSKAELGILASILSIAYGLSKFASGVLSDRANPRYFMAVGLILTAVCNILFGASSSFFWLAVFWGLNGWFQGWGWLPCTKQLTHWYAKSERGRWWSICSTSHNVGGALISILAAYCAEYYGWRWAMFIPGILCAFVGLFLLERLRDTPKSLGLPTIEVFKGEVQTAVEISQDAADAPAGWRQILFEQVLTNKFVWVLACVYFFVYVVRTAMNDWSYLYLIETKGCSTAIAGQIIAWFEVGGFLGVLASGWGSDHLFQGRRVPFMILCVLGLMLVIPLLWYLPPGYLFYDFILIALIGFFVFGPQMLVGLAAAEFVSKKAACTSNGFAGCFAYLGAAVAGWPLGQVIDSWGWYAFFAVIFLCSALSLAILLVLRALQKEDAEQQLEAEEGSRWPGTNLGDAEVNAS